jgi:subtilisin family serine protease
MNNPNIQNPQIQPSSKNDCLSLLIFTLMLAGIILVTYGRIFTQLFSSITPAPANDRFSLLYSAGEIILLGVPLVVISNTWRNQRYRVIFKTWTWAIGLTLCLIPVQLTSQMNSQAKSFLQILLSGIFIALILILYRRRPPNLALNSELHERRPDRQIASSWFLSITMAAFIVYPWLAWGTLGSFLDTILAVLAGLSLGAASGLILERFLIQPIPNISSVAQLPQSDKGGFFLGGLSIGATLAIVASGTGFSFGGMQLLLMLVWPALGWALMGLAMLASPGASRLKSLWLPLATLIGLAGAAPMAFINASELALVISITPGDILSWAFRSSVVSMMIGLALGLVMLYLIPVINRQSARVSPSGNQTTSPSSRVSWTSSLGVAAVSAWLIGAVIYFSAGQPGFHGERIFVVLRSQADVSAASGIKDYNQRRKYVYSTLVENANTSQANLRMALDRLGVPYTPYYLVNGLEVPDNPLLRAWLASRPEVDRILDSPHLRPLKTNPPPETGSIKEAPQAPEWNLTDIGADRVWNELHVTGQDVVVGQSDSGVQGDHPELVDNYRGKDGNNDYNWYDPWNNTTTPMDIGGHGTHTLGTVLGKHTGVAPGATWIGCVNLARNLGNPADYLNCMQFMLAPFPQSGDPFKDGDPSRGAMVLNNSWGCPEMEGCDADTFLPAVQALKAAGLFVEASAGNDGPNCKTLNDPPAIYADVFSTGAIDQSGQLADFSSLGPVTADESQRVKPDVVAPGVYVLSSLPGNTYGTLSGTSMAGPHVVGVVALMWSANPSLIGDIDRTEQILKDTAQPYTGVLPDCPGADGKPSTAVGYGVVDAYAAVKAALEAKPLN